MTVLDKPKQFTPERYIWTGPELSDARSLDANGYTSEAFFKAEMEHIHLRKWILLGRLDEWADPGFYRAMDTVGGPVLVVRDDANVLRAFANTCRHRGALLLEGCGVERKILCPYHAWSYRLNGKLLAAPSMEETIGFQKKDWGLSPIRLETWAGFVFINYADDAPSLRDDLGDLVDLLASHAMDDMVCTWRHELDVRCNWKLLVENAMETYHTGTVHAATVGSQKSVSYSGAGEWMGMQVLSKSSIAVLHGEPPFKPIASLSDQAKEGTFFTFLHPTTQFCNAQDCMWWLTVRPVAPDRTILSIGGCFPKDTVAQDYFEADAAPYYKRWEAVAREDAGVLEKLQTAIVSKRFRPGPLSWRDDLVHTFDQWVLNRLPIEARTA
jgi:phenylpropionate dioxygenase-like ring-hydroxylating dioxygenase large terminal subunit